MAQNEMNGLMFKVEDDPRITRVGRFIRRTSIDELPQFFDVVRGSMSLVGTRRPRWMSTGSTRAITSAAFP